MLFKNTYMGNARVVKTHHAIIDYTAHRSLSDLGQISQNFTTFFFYNAKDTPNCKNVVIEK